MKFLWLGSYQSDEQFQKMLARNIGQASGFASQKGIIKGIDQLLEAPDSMDSIGVVSYPPYPKYPKKKVDREEWSRTGSSKDISIGYIDIKYITYIFRSVSLMNEIKAWSSNIQDQIVVIVYEPSVAKLKAAQFLKKKHNAKIFVIIPDIPELVNLGANKLIKFGKKNAAKRMLSQFSYADGFILYSACMADYYGFTKDQWILMEGVFDPSEAVDINDEEPHSSIRLIYCGALDEFRGIPQLLEAFSELHDKEYELWLTGAGRSDGLIKEYALKDSRIHHFGYMDSREDVLRLQRKADILIHTRDISSPAAPYCFPSKVFEYLVTGKPVISVIVPGIPQEYFKYMIPIESMTSGDIKKSILIASDMNEDEIQKRGEEARRFVLENKNSIVQAQKILNFINSK